MNITYTRITRDWERERASELVSKHLINVAPGAFGSKHSHNLVVNDSRNLGYPGDISWMRPVQLQAVDDHAERLVAALQMFPNPTMLHHFATTRQHQFGRGLTMITHMATDPNYRNRKIGTQLLNIAKDQARESGFKTLGGFAEGDPSQLERFYSNNGFTTTNPDDKPYPVFGAYAQFMVTTEERSGFYFYTVL